MITAVVAIGRAKWEDRRQRRAGTTPLSLCLRVDPPIADTIALRHTVLAFDPVAALYFDAWTSFVFLRAFLTVLLLAFFYASVVLISQFIAQLAISKYG